MNSVQFLVDDKNLTAEAFLDLVQDVWPGSYNSAFVKEALEKTINVTAWEQNTLIGCARVLTDGYFFGTVPEILVRRSYQSKGIGKKIMELVWEVSPTSLFFGAQQGNEPFFEKLGYSKSLQSFGKKKPRRQ